MGLIAITGAAGFIGCNLVRRLNSEGKNNLLLVDHFSNETKKLNLEGTRFQQKVEREDFPEWLSENANEVECIFHLGARTDTTEFNFRVLDALNLSYSKSIWEICTVKDIPLVYASSAATYGLGERGFSDNHKNIPDLKPLNPYGVSKQLFDIYVLEQTKAPSHWCGLKFFNVYGPYEFHKGRMASVVLHAYRQIKEKRFVNLFASANPLYKDGEQLRDFIFVDDIIDICLFAMYRLKDNGIYNAGTGKARTFNDLAQAIFKALSIPDDIRYIPTPEDIKDKYQYFTEAEMIKLQASGYKKPFTDIETGVKKYVDWLKKQTF